MATFEQYGAIGDGVTDDRNSVYNALNSGNPITAKKGAIYYIGSNINISGKNISLHGSSMFLFKSNVTIKFNGVAGVNTVLSANSFVNDNYITVVNPSGFVSGDIISITTSQPDSWGYDIGYRNGELHEILNVAGNRIYIKDKIWTNWILGIFILKVVQFKPITVDMSGIVFKYEPPQLAMGGFVISYAKNNILSGVSMHDSQGIGIMFHYCYNNIFEDGVIDGTNSNIGGYGLRFQGCNKSDVYNSYFYRNIKSIESSSSPPTIYDYGQFPDRSLVVRNCFGYGCGKTDVGGILFDLGASFVHTHAPCQNIVVRNNYIENNYSSFICVGIDSEFKDNTISGRAMHVIMLIYGKNHKILRNTVNGTIGQLGGFGGSFLLNNDLSPAGNIEVLDNDVRILQKYFTAISGTLLVVNNSVIRNNIARYSDDPGYFYSWKNGFPGLVESGNVYIGTNVHETEV